MSSFDSGNTSAANARPNSADAEPIDVSIAEAPKEDTSYDRSTSNSASTAGLSHAVRHIALDAALTLGSGRPQRAPGDS